MTEVTPAGLVTQTPTAPTETPTTPTPETPATPEVAKVEEPAKPEAKPEAPKPLAAADIKIPDGFSVDDAGMTSFLEVMNDQSLSGADRAQKLLDMQIAREQAASEQGMKAWTDLQEQWQKTVKDDPEIGGAKYDETVSNIGRLLDKYKVPQETRDAFNVTGAGNNPHIVRFLNSIAKDLIEPAPVSGTPAAGGKDLASALYTKMGN